MLLVGGCANLTKRSKGVSSSWPYHWGMLGVTLLAFNFKSEDCAKRARIQAGLPVSDSDKHLGRSAQ